MENTKLLFKDISNEWLEFHKAKVKHSTYLMYKRYVEKLNVDFENISLSDITPIQVQKLLNNLCSIGYSKSTICKYRLTLQQIFNYGIKEGCAIRNCCEDTYVPKEAKVKKVGRVSDNDVKKILVSYDRHFGLFALILLTFGLRKSEALALTWEDVNIEENYISVNKIIEFKKSTPVICNYLKNGDEERIIPILPMVYPIIKKYKSASAGTGIIFSYKGEYLKRGRCEKEWNKYLNITGLQINKHQLRHTYATLLYKAGVDMKTAMILLGHRDIAMLMKIYTHTDMEMLSLSILTLSEYMLKQFEKK